MPKTYPDRFLQNALREKDLEARLMWDMKGPKDTSIAWVSCYVVNRSLVLVETFEGGGWEAFTPPQTNHINETIDDVLQRTK